MENPEEKKPESPSQFKNRIETVDAAIEILKENCESYVVITAQVGPDANRENKTALNVAISGMTCEMGDIIHKSLDFDILVPLLKAYHMFRDHIFENVDISEALQSHNDFKKHEQQIVNIIKAAFEGNSENDKQESNG